MFKFLKKDEKVKKLEDDIRFLIKLLLKIKPEYRDWCQINFNKYVD